MMPIIESQAQRDALIADCNKAIENLEKCLDWKPVEPVERQIISTILIHKIALATLEAEPVGTVVYGETSMLGVEYHDNVSAGDDLYVAPPVLHLTPVSLPGKADSSNIPFAANGWNAYHDEAIKAIKAAGYPVEGEK